MEDRITVSIYRADKERLKKYYTDPDLSYADVVRDVLDMLESKDLKPAHREIKDPGPVGEAASPTESGETSKEVAVKIAKAPPTGKKNPGGKKVPISDEIKAEVRKRKLEEPGLSNRKIAREIGISPAMANKILAVKKESKD